MNTWRHNNLPEDIKRDVMMPKRLFSKICLYEIKELIQSVKRPRRNEAALKRKSFKKDLKNHMVQKINNEPSAVKFSCQAEHRLHPTLEKLLQDQRSLAAFQTFLRSEFSEENIEFWLACEDFRSNTSAQNLRCRAEEMYSRFIQPMSCREVNVDHHIRVSIKKTLEKPSVSCFDEAQKHVYLLMERDSCPRFLLSTNYLSLTLKSRTMWYI